MNNLTTECLTALGDALKQFGEYAFDDKGPHEVMDTDALVLSFRKLPAVEAAKVLLEISNSKKYKGRGSYLASSLVGEMQDWDALFEQEGVEDLL
jgi:hypothetical protein